MKWILVRVRLHQVKRQLESLGLGYAFLLLAFLAAVIFYIYLAYLQKNKALYVFSLTVLILFLIHTSRKDKQFVHSQVNNPTQNIFTEYFIFTLPVTIPSLFTPHWIYFSLLILSFYVIANIKINLKQKTMFPHLSKIISPQNFEWLSGLRKNLILFMIFFALAAITCWIRILPLIFLWFIVISITSFYQECESLQILLASHTTPKKTLNQKIWNHSKYLLIILLPILVVNSIFNPGLILVNLVFLLVQFTVIIFAILLKYTTYSPNENLTGNVILVSAVTIGALIPFLLPIPLIICFRNYSKSVKNLNNYF